MEDCLLNERMAQWLGCYIAAVVTVTKSEKGTVLPAWKWKQEKQIPVMGALELRLDPKVIG